MANFPRIRRLISLHLAALVFLFSSGCASYPGRQLSPVTVQQLSSQPSLGEMDYSLTWQMMGNNSSAGLNEMEKLFAEVLQESGAFSSAILGKGHAPVHLDFVVNNHGNMALAMGSGFISGFTFLIIPGYAKDEYEMRVSVYREGHMLKHYKYDDAMATWFGWVFLPFMPKRMPQNVAKDVLGNMVRNFISDLQKDGVLVAAAGEQASAVVAEPQPVPDEPTPAPAETPAVTTP